MNRMAFVLSSILLLALAVRPAFCDTLTVNQSGFTFDPFSVTIQLGDTVKWIWTGGLHTVTSGTGSADPNVGALFDAPFDIGNPLFAYTFGDTAGTYPYFCTFHEALNMRGTVIVEASGTSVPGPLAEGIGWGSLKALFAK